MAKDLLRILETTGMTSVRAKLYVAGLSLGSARASEYARETGINRITAYNMLEEMVREGQCTAVKSIRGKQYAPVPPEYLAVEARKNADALQRSLPEFRALQGPKERRPHVRFFESWEGVRRIYDDTLTAKSELLNFANSAVVRSFWPNYDEEYVAERVKRGIHLRGISPDNPAGRKVHGEDRRKIREIRLVPARDFDFTNEINVYDSKVAICSFASQPQMFGVIIESREVAETQRQIFEMAWRYAGRK